MKILAKLHDIERQQCKEMGDQLGGTGQILPLHVFGHATPDRAGARPAFNVGSRDVTSAPSPHLSSPFASFRVFRGPIP
jgi:hypothetical protein